MIKRQIKSCNRCGKKKPMSEFSKCGFHKGKQYHRAYCKICKNQDYKLWYQSLLPPEKRQFMDNINNRRKTWQANMTPEDKQSRRKRNNLYIKEWRKNHPRSYTQEQKERNRERSVRWHQNLTLDQKKELHEQSRTRRRNASPKAKARHAEYNKQWATNNPDRIKEIQRRCVEKRREKITQYVRERCRTDINYRIKKQLRDRIYVALKGKGKSKPTMTLLGCSVDFLKDHIESQFKPGMTWENHGRYGWHIDHIRPCASFDLVNPIQQKECFYWENLQPLWAWDNRRKRDTWKPQPQAMGKRD